MMSNLINLINGILKDQTYHSILCLNGDLPYDALISTQLPIIAADGAANQLVEQGILPQLIIGDLDSVSQDIIEKMPSLHYPDQNTCDYQKCLEYLKEKKLLPTIVMGIQGGCLDHIVNNISIFMQSESVLFAPPLFGFMLKAQQSKTLDIPINRKISIVACPQAVISSEGLKWELNEHVLSFPATNSCLNRVENTPVKVEVHEGAVLILVYLVDAT